MIIKKLFPLFALMAFASVSAADFYEILEVAGERYRRVYVLSANASSLSVKHDKGLAQIQLSDLPPILQQKYGYKPSADEARTAKLDTVRERQAEEARLRMEERAQAARSQATRHSGRGTPTLKHAFERFGTHPKLQEEWDLRPRFRGHDIHVRQQRGPSCSVHAIAAALEYQYAENQGRRLNINERHLVEATARSLGRGTRNDLSSSALGGVTVDEGFALEHVFQAIRGFGLEAETRMPSGERHSQKIEDVSFSPFLIPGGNGKAGIANIVHVLNAGMPVVVGVAWPSDGRVRHTSLLSKQPPAAGAGHAVTIVGYKCPSGELEDTKFVFRNSWGVDWGAGGYGFFTYEYLANNLFSGYVVELR